VRLRKQPVGKSGLSKDAQAQEIRELKRKLVLAEEELQALMAKVGKGGEEGGERDSTPLERFQTGDSVGG
jgi:uncharacterized caspase-like protein